MTLSNNAIKFLQAQYRAIFKRAYIKGLATAVLLTAGLAAGQAQAASTPAFDTTYTANKTAPDVVITGTETLSGGSTGYAGDLTVQSGAIFNISGTASHSGIFSVGSGATLNVTGKINGNHVYTSGGGSVSADWTGSMDINGGNVNVSGMVETGEISMDGATVVIGKSGDDIKAHNQGAYIIGGYGNGDNDVNVAVNSTVTFQDYGFLQSNDRLIVQNSTLNFNGAKPSKASSTSAQTTEVPNFETAFIRGRDGVELTNTKIVVGDSKKGGIYGPTTSLNGGSIKVGSSGEFVFDGDWNGFNTPTNGKDTYSHAVGTISLTDVDITNSGTLTIGGSDHLADLTLTGGSMENTGTVNIYTDKISVSEDYFNGLFAGKNSKVTFGGSAINVDGEVDLNDLGIIGTNGTLTDNFEIGAGTVNLTANTISLDSAYKVGNLSLDASTLNIDAGASSAENKRFTFSSGTITVHDKLNGSSADQVLRIHASAGKSNATLNLDAGANGGVLNNIDRINVGLDSSKGKSELTVTGNWDFNDARLSVSSGGVASINGTVRNVSELMLEKNGAATVNGALTIERLLAGESGNTSSNLTVNGTLTVTGDGAADKGKEDFYNDVQLTETTVNINNGGTLAITKKDALDDFLTVDTDSGVITGITVSASGDKTTDIGGWDNNKVTLNAGGTLQLNLAELGATSIKSKLLAELKDALVATGSTGGSFDFGENFKVDLSDNQELDDAIDSGEVSYSQLLSGGVNNVQGVADNAIVTVDSATASGTDGITLSTGKAVELEGTKTVNVNSLILTNTSGGHFVYTTVSGNKVEEAAVQVTADGAVNLTGNGTVGSLTKAGGTATGTSAILTAGQGATQTVKGKIDLGEVTIGAGTVDVTESVTADELTVNGTLTVSGGEGAVSIGTTGATIAGTLNAGAVTSSGDMTVTGSVLANSIVLSGSASSLSVGDSSSSGLVEVETLDLNGGMLLIDPDWNQIASIVTVTGGTGASIDDVIDVSGSIGVGQNSVGVFGAAGQQEAQDALSRLGLLQASKLDEHGVGAVLYLGKALTVEDKKHVLVDKDLDNADLQAELTNLASTSSGSVTLREGSALVISESFSNELVDDPSKAIFNFAATAGSTVTVTAESGAKIIFDSADILGGDIVTVATSTATITTTLDNAEITAAGGLLIGDPDDNTDRITFILNPNASTRLYNQSNPIRDMTLDVIGNKNGAYDSADPGVYYIGAMNAHDGGADIERTARMALYGGAVQATLMAQQTSTDAISERLGMANPNSALIASNNAQGGGLWLSPVYKNHDSDEFEAEGVNYGADIDLYGLALGADFTTESGVRVGAMFNVGSGDAEGQGIGEGVSNDFDYYGFSLYAGVTFGNFALTADAGFTQVSNDLEQAVNYHGVGTLKADTDTQTVSVGVRGEYLFATPWVDVVPHVGVRYTSFDMDSYQAQVDGYTIANADADSMQVFSIPFGVTFSKDMAMGNWVVKPVFDLNLTANAGDDELESDVAFVGVSNVALTTEVMDSFTYGATLGVSAQYQESFSFGLNVGYTGSSSADEFGVNANARYTF